LFLTAGTSGLRLRKTASKGGALITLLSTGTPLAILEPAKKAKAEIGKANQWLSVRPRNNPRGYVSAEYIALP
jgi:SH3 domain-containing protein